MAWVPGALALSLMMSTLAPLAERLGLDETRAQLDNASLWVRAPAEARALQTRLASPQQDEAALDGLRDQTVAVLDQLGIEGVVTGRVKSLYSTYQKMARKGVDLDQIHDRVAVRVRVSTVEDCYRVRDGLSEHLEVVAGEDDDYIVAPKASGYQSLHTAFVLPGITAEVQIRTHAMHAAAGQGQQAHWRYKQVA